MAIRRTLQGWIEAMFKTERRQSAVFTLPLLGVGWWLAAVYFASAFPISEPLFQALTSLVIGTLWVERLFTPPRDALANAFAGLVLVLSLSRDPVFIPSLLVGLAVYFLIVLLSAIIASWSQQGEMGLVGSVYDVTHTLAVCGGSASVVYSLVVLATLTPLAKAGQDYPLARFLLFWLAALNLPNIIRRLARLFRRIPHTRVGFVRSATSPTNLEARIPQAEIASVSDLIGFEDTCRLCDESHPLTCYGRIVNMFSEPGISDARTAQIQVYGAWHTCEDCVRKRNPLGLSEVTDVLGVGQQVFKISDVQNLPTEVRELPVFAKHSSSVGYALDRSSVERLRFAIYPHHVARRGDVVGITLPGTEAATQPVYYQILDIVTSEEELTEPPFAMQYASAVQIGAAEENGRFRTHDVTPYVRMPVWPALEMSDRTREKPVGQIGTLPGTDIPVSLDLNALVAYHTAVLGTTGSGKTTMLRTLVPRLADHGIKVLVIDSHDEFDWENNANETCALTPGCPNVAEAFSLFVESEDLKTLLEKMGSKESDLSAGREKLDGYAEQTLFQNVTDVRTKRTSLGTSGKDKVVKKTLDQFTGVWYPQNYLGMRDCEDENSGPLDILVEWYEQTGGWNKPTLIAKLHNLSIDERRWVVGLMARRLFGLALKAGLTPFNSETGDPQAKVCLVVEEAHMLAPERGFSVGADDDARRFCEGELRNLMLHARKYGLGVIVASQRSAFIDKGVLSQCNTLFALKTLSVNDKKVFEDFMGSDWVDLVTHLGTPPESPQAILVGKAAASSIPLVVQYECSFGGGQA